MPQQKFQLEIVSPCAESVDNMSAHPQGFYCYTCEKKVVNFTDKLPAEIAQFFTVHRNGNICGRFYEHQLEEDYTFMDDNRKMPSLKYAAGFLVSMLLSEQVTAENLVLKPATEQVFNASEHNLVPKTLIIKGQVIDEATGKGIPHAQISISAKQQVYHKGATDANGFFEFAIKENYDVKTHLTVQDPTHQYKQSVLNLRQFVNQSYKIKIQRAKPAQSQPEPDVKMGDICIATPKATVGVVSPPKMGKPVFRKPKNK